MGEVDLPEMLHGCDQSEAASYGLFALMSAISEDCWCAGWLHNLELSLWQAREAGPMKFGMGEITQRQCDLLRLLSDEAGGWWVYGDKPCFLSLDEWRASLPPIPHERTAR